MKVASLGMYDHPGQRVANDALWQAMARILRARGVAEAPDALDRTRPVQAIWRDPDLLFGQICGYPLVTDATLSLRILAMPIYHAPGCEGATHRSVVVVRKGDGASTLVDYRGQRAAINGRDSNTGMNLFRELVATVADGRSFFGSVTETGSHRASARAIVADEADITAIDAVTYAALIRFEPELTRDLRVLAHTPASPTLPFVTARATDDDTVAALRDALRQALADPALEKARAALFLSGTTSRRETDFAGLLDLKRGAALAGYPDLA